MDILEMRGAMAVAAPERDSMVFRFHAMGESAEDVIVAIPAGAVGHLMAQITAAHQKLAMKAADNEAAVMPTELTGARPFWAPPKNEKVLLLQFDGLFELAVRLPKNTAAQLALVLRELVEGQPPVAPKPN